MPVRTNTYCYIPLRTGIGHYIRIYTTEPKNMPNMYTMQWHVLVCLRHVLVRMKSLYVPTIYTVYTIYVHKNHNDMQLVHMSGPKPVGQASTYLVGFWQVDGTYMVRFWQVDGTYMKYTYHLPTKTVPNTCSFDLRVWDI